MQIILKEGYHLTATNKRHIAEMITKGMMEGGTKRLYYVFSEMTDTTARLSIIKTETTDWGRKVNRKGHYAIEIKR